MINLPWFRCRFEDWNSEEVASLDLAAIGFLHLIRMKFLQRCKPVEKAIILRMARQHHANRRTVERVLAVLAARGLIVQTDEGVRCDDLSDEIKYRQGKSPKFRGSLAKVSPNMAQETQQNRENGLLDIDREIEGRPAGAPSTEIHSCNLVGCETPSPDGEAFPMSAIDEANLELEEIRRADHRDDDDDCLGDEDIDDGPEHAWIMEGWGEDKKRSGTCGT